MRLRHLVYLDAVVPRAGRKLVVAATTSETRTAAPPGDRRDTARIPPPDPAVFGLTGADAAWVARRQTPHPGGVYDDAARSSTRSGSRRCRAPSSAAPSPALATIDASRAARRAATGLDVSSRSATGHDPMISAPDALVRELCWLAATELSATGAPRTVTY